MAVSDQQWEAEIMLSCRWTLINVGSFGPRTVQERVGGARTPTRKAPGMSLVATLSFDLSTCTAPCAQANRE